MKSTMWRALVFLVLGAVFAGPAAAVADAPAAMTSALWTRSLDAYPLAVRSSFIILASLPDGALLVRSGPGIAALDAATGKTLWFLPDVLDAIVHGSSVLIRRGDVVFAVRARDGAVLWRSPCANARYIVAVGRRVLTSCGDASTVLDGASGNLVGRRPATFRMSPPDVRGARSLNDRFAMIANDFDGAWMGTEYAVVDAATGAYDWSETDFAVLGVSSGSILIAPYPGMLPWAPTGTVVRRRLFDGAVLGSRSYQLPPGSDPDGRGFVTVTPAAVYVSTSTYGLYRFPTGTTAASKVAEHAQVEAVLGDAAFYAVADDRFSGADLSVERRRGSGFGDRFIGRYAGLIAAGGDADNVGVAGERVAVRTGDVVVAARDGSVDVLDESGTRILTARNACPGNRRHVITDGNQLYVLCEPVAAGDRVALSAYALP
jgi:outer membrane protein assembly factor BamB